MTDSSPPPWPTAGVLRHDCADGSWHYDLLLAPHTPHGPDDRCALTWRVHDRPDTMALGARQPATALPRHRAYYLGLRSPVDLSDQRGRVQPLAWGESELIPARGDAPLRARVRWDGGTVLHYRITDTPGAIYVECVPPEPAS